MKEATAVLFLKMVFFKIAQKVDRYLGDPCKNICGHQELSTITQSGHTVYDQTNEAFSNDFFVF